MKNVQGSLMAFALVIPLCLTGCVNEQEIKDYLAGNDDYQRYLELQQSSMLDNEGYYSVADEDDDILGNGDILVSFADNRYLDMRYKLLDGTDVTDKCYMNAGDTLYVEAPQRKETSINTYQFDRLDIKANDGYDVNFEFENAENGTLKLSIPEGYRGKSLTVLPKGKFMERSISCRAVVITESGEMQTASGRWSLSDDTYCKTAETSEITTLTFSGTAGFTVKYEFDGDYYYVSDTSDNGSTITYNSVSFPSVKPSENAPDYTIELRKFVTVEFINPNYIDSITVNSTNVELIDNKLPKLKQNDNVIVKIKKGASIEKTEYTDTSREHSDGCKEYTLKLPNKESFELKIGLDGTTPNKPNFENVNILYTDQNGKQTAAENLRDNEKYDITITAKDGYKLVDKDIHFFDIGKIVDKNGVAKLTKVSKEKCRDRIEEVLEKCLKKTFAVYLPESDSAGQFEYKLDGDKLTAKNGEPVLVYVDQKLEVTYTAREGYKIPGSGVFGSDGKKKTVSIEIPENWEGKTLALGDFGIEVKKE